MTGGPILAWLLSYGRTVVPWRDAPEVPPQATGTPCAGSPTTIRIGSSTFRVPELAAVRHREGCTVVYLDGRTHLLVESGELVLSDAEEMALRAAWPTL